MSARPDGSVDFIHKRILRIVQDHLLVLAGRTFAVACYLNEESSKQARASKQQGSGLGSEVLRKICTRVIFVAGCNDSSAPVWRQRVSLQTAEIGHIHTGGIVDIPFPRSVRDSLLAEGLAEEHHWVPNSGWITFQVRGEEDLKHALWLMRLSYMRYALKIACDPRRFLDEQSEELQLSPHLKSLFEGFFPKSAAA